MKVRHNIESSSKYSKVHHNIVKSSKKLNLDKTENPPQMILESQKINHQNCQSRQMREKDQNSSYGIP